MPEVTLSKLLIWLDKGSALAFKPLIYRTSPLFAAQPLPDGLLQQIALVAHAHINMRGLFTFELGPIC